MEMKLLPPSIESIRFLIRSTEEGNIVLNSLVISNANQYEV